MTEITVSPDKRIANVLPDAILILDAEGAIHWWNLSASHMFALKANNPQTHIKELFDHPDIEIPIVCTEDSGIELKLPGDPNKRISVSLLPYQENQYILVARDVTHVYHLEKMRQDFLANVSHELRTPLTVVHGYLETLLDQPLDDQGPFKRIFTHMYDQSRRMENLVNDLLLLSRLEAEVPDNHHNQKIFVAPMLHAICHEAEALSGDKKHQFHLDIDTSLLVNGFEDELRSAFSNLIFNAVKYTPAKEHIYISWQLIKQRPRLTVRDTGIGIESKHIPRLTERFYRVDRARSRSSGGTGLGLAIVKHVLIRHRAKLVIESEYGTGSSFSCVFPKQK